MITNIWKVLVMSVHHRGIAMPLAFVGAALWAGAGGAQTLPSLTQINPPAAIPGTINLSLQDKLDNDRSEGWFKLGDQRIVHNVVEPTLTPFLPDPDIATGSAIIIAPGGGFFFESIDDEGFKVAEWLAEHGVAAFVLKYRLEQTPSGEEAFAAAAIAAAASLRATGVENAGFGPKIELAVQDAQEAMRTVRERSHEWNVDPQKVGFMGFSAGAIAALHLLSANMEGTMPDFIVPIYGPVSTPTFPLPDKLPPMFNTLAADDDLFGDTDLGLINKWLGKAPVEFHLLEGGGHGFGYAGTPQTSSAYWRDTFLAWLKTRRLAE